VLYADPVIAGGSDDTPPTVWLPQRLPWNPGGKGGGSLWGWPTGDGADMPGDFYVWTFAYDVSGLARVELRYRIDGDGQNPMTSDQNETYAGGAEVGSWQTLSMNFRDFPEGNYFSDPNIDFSVLPDYMADQYYIQVNGLSEVLVDYYVEAEDSLGNIKRSPIQHVWVGEPSGSPSHVIDGSLDSTATRVSTNGDLDLYADWDGEYLYLATQGIGSTTLGDHFILVGVDLAGPFAAPWAKSGQVTDRTLYLANEDDNNWCGWFDQMETVLSSDVECASGSYLEGLIRLETHMDTLPGGIYLAAASYQSPDGGSLSWQVPAGDGDGDVESAEYVFFPLSTAGVTPLPDPGPGLSAAPNPFRTGTRISLALSWSGPVRLEVFDIAGRRIAGLADEIAPAGVKTYAWEGRDGSGRPLPAGIYFIRLASPDGTITRKVVLTR
jgi:hypothetical protein